MISGQHLRNVLYAVLSAGSGAAWVVICLLAIGNITDGRWSLDGSLAILLLFGAISGLAVGLSMNRFYRAHDSGPTIYSAPLAMWIGIFSFMAQYNLYERPDDWHGFVNAAGLAIYVLTTPFVLLLPLAMINGLLLRLVLRFGHEQRPQ